MGRIKILDKKFSLLVNNCVLIDRVIHVDYKVAVTIVCAIFEALALIILIAGYFLSLKYPAITLTNSTPFFILYSPLLIIRFIT